MHKKINSFLVFIVVMLILYIISTFFVDYNRLFARKNVDIKLNYENIYLLSGEEKEVISSFKDVEWTSDDENIAIIDNGIIKAKGIGKTKINAIYYDIKKSINVTVTDLITKPQINNDKAYLKCKQYTEEEAHLLDKLLEYRINEAGKNTRSGALAAARFLTLEFPYRISYFYENGRLLTNDSRPYVDGEGRYYHKGLYLSEDKYKNLKASMHGPAIWGCNLFSRVTGETSLNGLDCSGYVSWALFNAGFDVGDGGAGINLHKDNDLDDLGEKLTITKDNLHSNKYKVGDLMSAYGHIGMLIGKDDEYFYIAEALDDDLHVLSLKEKELLDSEWKYIILLDNLYKEDGNLTNMW